MLKLWQRNKNNSLRDSWLSNLAYFEGDWMARQLRLEFDPEYEIVTWNISQLVPGTVDGFPEINSQVHPEIGPDPPWQDYPDPIYDGYDRDPPHWED